MFKRFEGLWIGLGALAWFLILTPWGEFNDPDAFYHAHMASLILDHGPLHAFPWLDLTTFGQHFVDAHFLFHVTLIPAIALARTVAYGPLAELWGAQAMAPVLATGTILVLWWALRRLDPKRAWVWTILALLIPGFSVRLLLGKASPIAVGLFVGMLGCLIHPSKARRGKTSLLRLTLTLVGFLFALSHGGWIILPIALGAFMAAEILFERFVRGVSWMTAFRAASWDAVWTVGAGLVAGLLLHPNRDELFRFLWVQVFKAGSGANGSVMQGGEWLPASPSFIVFHLASLLIPLLIAAWGTLLAWSSGKRPSIETMKRIVTLALPAALTLALTLNSRRFIEYLAPAMTLWIASLWMLVDESQIKAALCELADSWPRALRRAVPTLIALCLCFTVAHQAVETWNQLRENGRAFNAWRGTLAAISARANPGDRVFADWDEFPNLFAADDRLHFVSGLDPVFLDDANPHLSDDIEDLLRQRKPWTAWKTISETGSRFVLVVLKRHPLLAQALAEDPRFHELAHDHETAAYELAQPSQK